jgi:MFS family permease
MKPALSLPALPRPAYAWYTVILLTTVYVFSFIDRFILSLLVEPIKNDMNLTDTQIGLLLGPAFAIFYTTMGIPLGWLADHARRTWIIGIGITLWSLATAASGLAKGFAQLFTARIAVGVGEATLSPCALSIIADSFPPEQRGKPIAFYNSAVSLGAGIAFLVGASVIVWSRTVTEVSVPGFGEVAPWQYAFILVGLAGLPVAILMFTLREPARQKQSDEPAVGTASPKAAFKYVRSNWQAYGFVLVACIMTTVTYSQNWLPAMYQRTWGWPPERYAFYYGIALVIIGPLTVNLSGWFSDKLYAKGKHDAPVLVIIWGGLLLIPTGFLSPLMPTGELAFAVLLFNLVGLAMVSALAPVALLNITPSEIRGQIIAIYYLIISITGLVLGPMTVGLLNDLVVGEQNARYSVALVPVIFGLPVIALMRWALRSYRSKILASTA